MDIYQKYFFQNIGKILKKYRYAVVQNSNMLDISWKYSKIYQ